MTENPYEPPEVSAAEDTGPTKPHEQLPELRKDKSFWGLIVTQFLGAFNDNLFKQLVLLLAIPTAVAASSLTEKDQQGAATIVFAAAFVLFSGFAGFLADRFSKRGIIIPSKIAEIFVMALGLVAFLSIDTLGFTGLLVVLFLMGTQSAFFGPGKYGILPEMLRERDLPTANGIMMMTTFFAIILGTAIAGVFQHALSREMLWIGSLVCIGIAMLGTLTSFMIRKVPAARPDLQFQLSSVTVPPESRKVLASDRRLLLAILASCMFWLVAGVAIQAVNSFGMVQLKIGGLLTSIMTAIIAVGIAIGGVIAGPLCRGRPNPRFVKLGMWGIVLWLAVLSISLPDGRHLLGFGGSLVVLVMVGISAAFFAIPVQVVIQARPPKGLKGRMIAVMNQTNFIAILLSGVIWMAFDRIADGMQWPRSVIFAMIAALMLPVAIFYRLNPGTQIDSADNTSDTE